MFTSISLHDRFWAKVDAKGPDECWLWTGARHRDGPPHYGVGFIRINKKSCRPAPRIGWELVNGEIPEGICVLHTCDNARCCNPAHWWLGTRADNNRDRDRKGRGKLKRGKSRAEAAITLGQAKEIRLRYSTKKVSQDKLAREYGISQPTVCRIVRQEGWWEE